MTDARNLVDEIVHRLERMGPEASWEIRTVASESEQILCDGLEGGLAVRQVRNVKEASTQVSLRLRKGDRMGAASAPVSPDVDLDLQLETLRSAAAAGDNPAWDLPSPGMLPEAPPVRTADPEILASPARAARGLQERIASTCAGLAGVSVNSTELYVTATRIVRRFSTGLRLAEERTDFYFEAALEKLPGPNLQEVHRYERGVGLMDFDADRILGEWAEEAGSLGATTVPATDDRAVLLLKAADFAALLEDLVDHLDASREYEGRPFLKPGDRATSGITSGDLLDVRLDPHVDFLAASSRTTTDGLPSRGGVAFEGGVARERTASFRHAQYLKLPPTGLCGNMVVAPGSLGRDELLALHPRVIEVKSFLSLLTDPDGLSWSSELKLGVEYVSGKPVGQLKGGVLSGNFRENLLNLRFSRETSRVNRPEGDRGLGYEGPAWILLAAGVRIAGE